MKRAIEAFNRAFDRGVVFIGLVAGVIPVIIAVIVTYGVFMRYFMRAPEQWSLEISTYMLVVTVFLALAYTQLIGGHVAVDLVSSHLPRKAKDILSRLVTPGMGIIFCVVLTWQSGKQSLYSQQISETSGSVLLLPLFPVKVFIPIGIGLLALVFLTQLRRGIRFDTKRGL